MSDRADIERTLTSLEERVVKAVARIGELTAENRRLTAAAIAGTPAAATADGASDPGLAERMRELDRERQGLAADRRVLTQRVEAILARLEYLESETAPH